MINIAKFTKKFPDDESCRLHLKETGEKGGISCRNCKKPTKHYWIKSREQWRCSICRSTTSLFSGTVFQDSNLPLYYWYVTIMLMLSNKKGISAKAVQEQLEHKNYEPIWYMVQKLRSFMGSHDSKYHLSGDLEIDEGFITAFDVNELGQPEKENKRGRGSLTKAAVLIIAETEELENPKKKDLKPN